MSENPTSMKEILHRQNATTISRQVSPACVVDVSDDNFQRAVVDESGIIRSQLGRHNKSKWSQCKGRLAYPSRNNNPPLPFYALQADVP
jgi:hypothetical protein